MKYLFILLFSLSFTFSYAETSPKRTIQELIIAIQSASDDERFALMNTFKKELRSLNSTARRQAFIKLQKSLQNSEAVGLQSIPTENRSVMTVEQAQTHIQDQQHIQNLNQVQQIVPELFNDINLPGEFK